MYDCIVLESCSLPSGVTLPAVLDGCDESELAEVLRHIPNPASITKEDLEATGPTSCSNASEDGLAMKLPWNTLFLTVSLRYSSNLLEPVLAMHPMEHDWI